MRKVLFLTALVLVLASCGKREKKLSWESNYRSYNDYATDKLNTLKRPVVVFSSINRISMGNSEQSYGYKASITVKDGDGKLYSFTDCPIIESICVSYAVNDTIAK